MYIHLGSAELRRDADTVETRATPLINTHTHMHTLFPTWLLSTKNRRKTIWKGILDFRSWSSAWDWHPSRRAMSVYTLTHIHLIHLTVSAPVALAHSMDDQKRPTAADHYANDTLSKSPESAATWQPLGIESGTLKEDWRITVNAESKAQSEIFIMYCRGKFLLKLSL